MPSTTFDHLPTAKRDRVTAALLAEFSAHSLADAQVARIVASADIARGAFYKYFDDLTDAYQYLYRVALREIHRDAGGDERTTFDADCIYQGVVDFVDQINDSQYYAFIRRHYAENESLLPSAAVSPRLPAIAWAAMVLSHAAIKEILLDPESETTVRERLRTTLALLQPKED